MNKLFTYLIIGIFLISFTSAFLGTFQQGESISVRANLNATSVNTTIYFPNGSIAIDDKAMTNLYGDIYEFTFNKTSTLGEYIYDYCNQDGNNCKENNFKVTYSGIGFSTAQSILMGFFLSILVFLIVANPFVITMLPNANQRAEDGKILSISYLKYLRSTLLFVEYMFVVTLFYVSSNIAFAYLGEQLIAKTLFVFFRISFGLAPLIVIVWMAWIIVQIVQDKELMNLMRRGVFGREM